MLHLLSGERGDCIFIKLSILQLSAELRMGIESELRCSRVCPQKTEKKGFYLQVVFWVGGLERRHRHLQSPEISSSRYRMRDHQEPDRTGVISHSYAAV